MSEIQIKQTILIVDDTPENIELLTELLDPFYRTRVAINGEKALKIAFSNTPPDLILLDIMMPGISGYDVCIRLKENAATRDIPVIFVTGMNEMADEKKGLELGAVDYITKPISPSIALARIQTHLAMSTQSRKLEAANRLVRQTFGRYLSEEVVNDILSSPDGATLGGESRLITIMMTDLRGFTAISERLPASDVLAMINIYLESMTEIVMKYDGTIIEFIGDAILAVFGAPVLRVDDAERGVACAIEMQNAMVKVNARCTELGYPRIEQGIGLNTGESVVGNIGSDKRTKYGIVGRNVNLTSRIESYTVGGQILIPEATATACGPILQVKAALEVMPKGVIKPITLFDVAGIAGAYNVSLASAPPPRLVELHKGVAVSFIVLEGKHATMKAYEGTIKRMSLREAVIHAEIAAEPLSNLKLTMIDDNGEVVTSGFYVKVIEMDSSSDHPAAFKVNFTSTPPEALTFLDRVLAGSCVNV